MDSTKYLLIPPKNPLHPHETTIIGSCRQGIPCRHCFSQDNGITFTPKYGHDIYAFIMDSTDPTIRSHRIFKHLKGMFDANNLLKLKPPKPIATPITPMMIN